VALQLGSIRLLASVVARGSFAEAAREIGYTPSAVSQHIAALERELGLQLFEREPTRIRPTTAARYLADRSGELVTLVAQLESDARRLAGGQAGRLRIGSFPSAGDALLAPAIATFLVKRREAELTLDEGEPAELLPAVVDGRLDVALGFAYSTVPVAWPEALEVTDLGSEPTFVVASSRHRFAGRETVGIAELQDEVWIANRETTTAYAMLRSLGAQHGFTPRTLFRTNNFATMRGLISERLGVAMLPALALQPSSRLTVLPIQDSLPTRRIVAVHRRVDRGVLIEPFLDSLQKVAARLKGMDSHSG
jgi:DNA-binding transcriptional LysR family regulator